MMIPTLAFLAFTVAILSGCSGGGCDNRVNDIVENAEEGGYPDALKNDLRALRDAALVFSQRGRASECSNLANAMDDLLDDVTEKMEAEQARTRRLNYLESARPVTQIRRVVKAEEVIDVPVYNLKDQELGAIENVALNPNSGQIAYVALSTGGFLGLGEKLVAVPWKRLSVTSDEEVYVLDLSPEALEKMQGFDAEKWPHQAVDQLPRGDARPLPKETAQ